MNPPPYFKMLNDANVASSRYQLRRCQGIQNTKNIVGIRNFLFFWCWIRLINMIVYSIWWEFWAITLIMLCDFHFASNTKDRRGQMVCIASWTSMDEHYFIRFYCEGNLGHFVFTISFSVHSNSLMHCKNTSNVPQIPWYNFSKTTWQK